MKLVRSSNDRACLEMVARERVTAYAIDILIGREMLEKHPEVLSNIVHLPWAINKTTYHLLVSKDHPQGNEIISRFNAGLAKLKTSPLWDEIHRRHGIIQERMAVEQTPLDDLKILETVP